jgi:hypothetical protein
MPVYKVTIYYSGKRQYEVESTDKDQALEDALCEMDSDPFTVDNIDDHDVEELHGVMTDLEELQAEEDRHDRKVDG